MTREEAAAAAGAQPSAIDAWERGRSLPDLLQFRQLIAAYGVMAGELLFGENPLRIPRAEAGELFRATRDCSSGLRTRLDLLVTLIGEPDTEQAATRQ